MKLLAIAGALAALFLTASIAATTAAAAPDNKNTGPLQLSCEGLGDMGATIVQRSSAQVAFASDGQVLVAKRISEHVDVTFTIDGEVVATLSDDFGGGAKGSGFESRLTECDYGITFEDDFVLDEDAAAFLGIDPSLVGETVHETTDFTGTAWALIPGR